MWKFLRSAAILLPLLVWQGCTGAKRDAGIADHAGASTREKATADTVEGRTPSKETALALALSMDQPHAADAHYEITLDQIRAHQHDQSAVIVDARHPDDFAHGHVPDAINLPAGPQMESYQSEVLRDAAPEQLIIIYCASPACGSGDMVYEYLLTQGFTNVRVFKPGWRTLKDVQF